MKSPMRPEFFRAAAFRSAAVAVACCCLAGGASGASSGPGSAKGEDSTGESRANAVRLQIGDMIPAGKSMRGVKIPSFDGNHLTSLVLAKTMTRIDDDNLDVEGMEIRMFDENGERDMTIVIDKGNYNMKDLVLTSDRPTRIHRGDFDLVGDSFLYSSQDGQGELQGNVRMRITDYSRFSKPAPGGENAEGAAEPAETTDAKPAETTDAKPASEKKGGGSSPPIDVTAKGSADFNVHRNAVVFREDVQLVHPDFDMICDLMEVHMDAQGGIGSAVASGYVEILRRPGATGSKPAKMGSGKEVQVAKARKAVYDPSRETIELRELPQIQHGKTLHAAASPETYMVLQQNGGLKTYGPSQTNIIRKKN